MEDESEGKEGEEVRNDKERKGTKKEEEEKR